MLRSPASSSVCNISSRLRGSCWLSFSGTSRRHNCNCTAGVLPTSPAFQGGRFAAAISSLAL